MHMLWDAIAMIKVLLILVKLGPQLADIIERAETAWLNTHTIADRAHVIADALEQLTAALRDDLK